MSAKFPDGRTGQAAPVLDEDKAEPAPAGPAAEDEAEDTEAIELPLEEGQFDSQPG